MARKPNYDFEKRRKEQERQKKKTAKREERLRRKRDGGSGEAEVDEEGVDVAQPAEGPIA